MWRGQRLRSEGGEKAAKQGAKDSVSQRERWSRAQRQSKERQGERGARQMKQGAWTADAETVAAAKSVVMVTLDGGKPTLAKAFSQAESKSGHKRTSSCAKIIAWTVRQGLAHTAASILSSLSKRSRILEQSGVRLRHARIETGNPQNRRRYYFNTLKCGARKARCFFE